MYLSLVFILLLALVGALIESASIQTMKNYRRADVNRGMECMFAEYQKELLEQYKVFAIEGSYESGTYSEDKVLGRLDYYCEGNINNKIERIQFLSDNNGKPFYDQVILYMEQKYELDIWTDKIGSKEYWEQQEEKVEEYETGQEASQKQLEDLLAENEVQLPEEGSPISILDDLQTLSIVDLILPEGRTVSEKGISQGELLSQRQIQRCYGDFSDQDRENSLVISQGLFQQYLLDHFTTAADEETGHALDYEVEYLIAGKQSDRENLKEVMNKLLVIRLIPNYVFLQTDAQKKAEAEALALTICTALAVPMITEAAAQVILLAWAYGESLMDLKALLDGKKVPLVKTGECWQLSLEGLLSLKEGIGGQDGKDSENGLKYEEYLRILLLLSEKESLSMRALDLIEQNMRKTYGHSWFRVDQCISKIEVHSQCSLRRGITYEFSTYYGYN